jgi:hypothetical protein
MQSDPATLVYLVVGIGVADAFTIYGSYVALSVWRGMAVPIYRSRALWMALFGVPFIGVLTYFGMKTIVLPSDSPFASQLIGEVIFTIPLVTLFAWMDRNISTVIRLDYLRRDLLHWSRFRLVYWALVILGNILFFSIYTPFPVPRVVAGPMAFAPLVYGSLALAKGARRTQDMTFRSHAKWLGFLGLAFAPVILVYSLTTNPVPSLLTLVPFAFCFYKAARYLIPIGKLS